ncbi:MFS general substrate transporter [Aspergillus steynii IBT 23096]|uniref:MFS general substrate transporter n=1 Tax=Aspergillus steynii IBT 23096 TaxID=1392250 RepID=A0A2I2GGN8_9EURO|nr:MFS general substrate transporter [Aspergillus steynii IBT 23096]PLB52044.1 MFS general substrate transporter [Aspergillus steynii IBT 23096]
MGTDNVHIGVAAPRDEDISSISREASTWKGYVKSKWERYPDERRMLFKADLCLTLMGFLGTIIKHIDRSNLTNAFVSGMKQDLKLYGNEMNYASTAFSVASILAIWPINIAMTRMNPRYFIPSLELGWSICTFCQAAMRTPTQMYVLRVLVGIFECGHFSAFMYICGAWYKKRELSKRVALINCAVHIGPMYSSYFQSAAYNGLKGVNGMAGWQWAFIIDGVLSLGITLPGFYAILDVPARMKPDHIFSEKELELARARIPKEGNVKQERFTRKQLLRWISTPEIWLLWVISIANGIGGQPTNSIAYWFQAWAEREPGSFTVAQINDYVTPVYAITLVLDLCFAYSSDTWLKGRRWPMLILASSIQAIVCILLATTPVFPHPKTFRWFLYYQTGWLEASSTLFWAWAQDILSGDPGTRAFASGGLNLWSSVFGATIPLAVFKTVDQPGVVGGNWTAVGFCIAGILATSGTAVLEKRKKARRGEGEREREDGV